MFVFRTCNTCFEIRRFYFITEALSSSSSLSPQYSQNIYLMNLAVSLKGDLILKNIYKQLQILRKSLCYSFWQLQLEYLTEYLHRGRQIFKCRAWKVKSLRERFFVYVKICLRTHSVRCYVVHDKFRMLVQNTYERTQVPADIEHISFVFIYSFFTKSYLIVFANFLIAYTT